MYIYIYVHVRIHHPITPLFANVIHLFRCVFIVWSLSESQAITDHLLQAHVAPAKHDWLVVWLPFFYFPIQLGISSSRLTFIFFRRVAQPPTRWTQACFQQKVCQSIWLHVVLYQIIPTYLNKASHLSLSIGSRDLLVFSMPSIPLSAPPNT